MIIVPLTSQYDRRSFDCGQPPLNEFLQKQARKHAERRVSKTFVLVEEETSTEILGYHTTLVSHLTYDLLPRTLTKGFIPALFLARLAVHHNRQKQGLGDVLMVDVLRRALIISEQTGLYAVVLDAMNEGAKRFYLRYGFKALLDDPLHLYLPIDTILEFGLTESE